MMRAGFVLGPPNECAGWSARFLLLLLLNPGGKEVEKTQGSQRVGASHHLFPPCLKIFLGYILSLLFRRCGGSVGGGGLSRLASKELYK